MLSHIWECVVYATQWFWNAGNLRWRTAEWNLRAEKCATTAPFCFSSVWNSCKILGDGTHIHTQAHKQTQKEEVQVRTAVSSLYSVPPFFSLPSSRTHLRRCCRLSTTAYWCSLYPTLPLCCRAVCHGSLIVHNRRKVGCSVDNSRTQTL
jgi:hypothetical protein